MDGVNGQGGKQRRLQAVFAVLGDLGPSVPHLVPRTSRSEGRLDVEGRPSPLIEATGSCVGDPELKAKALIEIAGVGQRYSGAYYVARVAHTVDDGGYVCEFACQRNAVS